MVQHRRGPQPRVRAVRRALPGQRVDPALGKALLPAVPLGAAAATVIIAVIAKVNTIDNVIIVIKVSIVIVIIIK